ncbi:MAG TPA: hypothetical protein VF466_00140 [Candidatus Saccharimonadales bacterium]
MTEQWTNPADLPALDLGIDAAALVDLVVGDFDPPHGRNPLDTEIDAARTQAMNEWDALRSPLQSPKPLASNHVAESLWPNPVTLRSERF